MVDHIYLTVSEFARLHNVNKRTLHYYDTIGIFSPQKVGENGYRYYTYLQGAQFEMILALRELGMGIEEIRDYQNNRGAQALDQMLAEKTAEVDEKIRQLKHMKGMLTHQRENLLLAQSDRLQTIDVIRCKTEYLLLTDISHLTHEDQLDENVFVSLAKYHSAGKTVRAFNSSYGSMIALEQLQQRNYRKYAWLFVKIPEPINKKELTRKPGGSYLRAYCKGSWEHIPATYTRMAAYAEAHHLCFTGPSYEEGINELGIPSAEDMDQYVTQITIPCADYG